MCTFLALVHNQGPRFSSSLLFICTRLPSGRSNRSPCIILNLFSQYVSNLIEFCVAPVYAIMCIELFMYGFPLQLLHSLVFCIYDSDTLVLLLLIKYFFMLLSVSDPNHHSPSGIPRLLPFILLRDVSFSMYTSAFMKYPFPSWRLTPVVQKYGSLH